MMISTVILLLLGAIAFMESRPDGAPQQTCQSMLPFHGLYTKMEGPAPFYLRVHAAMVPIGNPRRNKTALALNVTLLATTDSLNMMGFFIQGRVSQQDTKIVGSFLPLADSEPAHLMDCVGGRNNAVTHVNNTEKKRVSFLWQPPANFSESMFFRATVVREFYTFWVGIESPPITFPLGDL